MEGRWERQWEQKRYCWGHREVAGEVIRTGEAFFKVQKENRMGFWASEISPHPGSELLPMSMTSANKEKIILGNGLLLTISGYIFVITFQMTQLAPSKSHLQEGSVNEDSHKNNPVPPSFYYSRLSSVYATVRSRVRG